MYFIFKPEAEAIDAVLGTYGGEDYSYPQVGATREQGPTPQGFNVDHNRICLGRGEAVFERASTALRDWEMFNLGWVQAVDRGAPLRPETAVATLARSYGLWWLNLCRIVYLIEDVGPVRRFGFAYGTLPHHVERGEERFLIEWNRADDTVWYDIFAFSQPAYWMVKLGRPLARSLQRKFARDSKQAMLRAVSAGGQANGKREV
jgi:uncharacterized protein (UPF0548 family)